MPAQLILLPVAVLAAGAVAAWALRLLIPRSGRLVAAFVAWAALVSLVAIWASQRTALDFNGGELGAGVRLAVRLDAVSFAFCVFELLPVALLLTFLRSPSPPLALLATAASLFTFLSGGLILAALGFGAALLLVAMLLQAGGEAKPMTTRLRDQAALLLLLWAAAAIYTRAGTDQYAAVPISALQPGVFGLVALASLLASGLVPWKAWPSSLWQRLRPETAGPATALLFFTGFYFLVRMYQAGGGHYPGAYFNLGLALLGVVCAGSATLRAQAASSRTAFFGETLPVSGGFALLALALGTPLGVAAAIATLATASLLCALLPLVPEDSPTGPGLLLLVATIGLPPTAVFGTRLLDLQAAVEANEVSGYLALAAAAIWVVGIAAAARAIHLEPHPQPGRPRSRWAALMVALALLAGGAALGVLQTVIAIPAASTVVSFPSSALTGGLVATAAASGSWPAVALGGLLALAAMGLLVAARRSPAPAAAAKPPEPFFAPTWRALPDRLGALADALEVPAEFQVTGWQRVDEALTSGSIWVWIALFAILAIVVTR